MNKYKTILENLIKTENVLIKNNVNSEILNDFIVETYQWLKLRYYFGRVGMIQMLIDSNEIKERIINES